jgi:hypothetical protein
LSFKALLVARSLKLPGAHHRFAKSLEPSNLRDAAMASNPDMSLERLRFYPRSDVSQKPHFGAKPRAGPRTAPAPAAQFARLT